MEGIPKIGVYLEIFSLTRCLTQEEDGRAGWRSVDRYKFTHHRWVGLSDDRIRKMDQDPTYNLKMVTKGYIIRTPVLQGVTK